MDRRTFLALLGGGVVFATAPIWADPVTWKSEEELEKDILEDFISPKGTIERKDISKLLQIIQKNGNTIAKGLHIGDGYHLTNYHVIRDGLEDLEINAQMLFYRTLEDRPLELVTYDERADLALLKSPSRGKRGNALVHLPSQNLEENDAVSYFTVVSGRPRNEDMVQELYGVDYHDRKTKTRIGRIILPAESRLLESEGFVLAHDILTDEKRQKLGLSGEIFTPTSLLSYNGKSGSGIFRKTNEGKYEFTGVISSAISFGNYIDAPNHPLGYRDMEQVATYVVGRNPIEDMIRNYLANSNKIS